MAETRSIVGRSSRKKACATISNAFITGNRWLSAPAATGGTTGIPLSLVRTLRGVVFEQACQDRLIEQLGADPRGRVAILRGDNIKDPSDLKPPHWIKANGGRSLIFSSNVLNHETVRDYARALREFSPTLLCAYPTSLECLCRLLQQHDERVRIPSVLTSSEVLKREAWSLARDTLGCNLADYYGQAERVAFAYAFEPRNVPLPAELWPRGTSAIRVGPDCGRGTGRPLRDRRHHVLEQSHAPGALPHG